MSTRRDEFGRYAGAGNGGSPAIADPHEWDDTKSALLKGKSVTTPKSSGGSSSSGAEFTSRDPSAGISEMLSGAQGSPGGGYERAEPPSDDDLHAMMGYGSPGKPDVSLGGAEDIAEEGPWHD